MGRARNVYFSDEDLDRRLTAFAAGLRRGKGEAIGVLFEEAAGNVRRVRAAVREPVQRILVAVAELRRAGPAGLLEDQRLDLLRKIELAAADVELATAKAGAT